MEVRLDGRQPADLELDRLMKGIPPGLGQAAPELWVHAPLLTRIDCDSRRALGTSGVFWHGIELGPEAAWRPMRTAEMTRREILPPTAQRRAGPRSPSAPWEGRAPPRCSVPRTVPRVRISPDFLTVSKTVWRCCQSNANQSPIGPDEGLFRPPIRATPPARLSGSVCIRLFD